MVERIRRGNALGQIRRMSPEPGQPAFRMVWRSRVAPGRGRSKRTYSREFATAWADHLNRRFPELTHWCVKVSA